ncbi:MAG: DUF2069 domain-containing protein [Methylococcales bacterium]|nr:DUF2069 domain-containing protein [Methylococcales bacterium]
MNTRYFHWLAVSAFLGLFSLLMLWQTVLFPSTRFPVALSLLLSITPLLIPLRGFLNANKKSCSWMAYLSLFYFIHGAIEAYANADERMLAISEVFLSLLLFFGAAFYVRPPFSRAHD